MVSRFNPFRRPIDALQFVVPVAVPLPPRLLDQVTCVTRTLSTAVPPNVIVDVPVLNAAAVVGLVIVTAGDVVSEAVMVHVKVRDAVSEPSETLAETLYVPAVVGVPRMRPVPGATASPFGRPVAL